MVADKIANLPQGSNQHAPIGATSQTKAAGSSSPRRFLGAPGGWRMAAAKSLGRSVKGRLSDVRGMPFLSFLV